MSRKSQSIENLAAESLALSGRFTLNMNEDNKAQHKIRAKRLQDSAIYMVEKQHLKIKAKYLYSKK